MAKSSMQAKALAIEQISTRWKLEPTKTTNPHKTNVIRKIWAGGGEIKKAKIFETDNEELAYEIERETIKAIGLSNLTNILEGGDGFRADNPTRLKQREAASNANAKVWDGFVDPWGNKYPNIVNLFRFCEEHNLTYYSMVAVADGTLKQHKGWRNIDEPCYFDTEHCCDLPGWLFGIYREVDNLTSV